MYKTLRGLPAPGGRYQYCTAAAANIGNNNNRDYSSITRGGSAHILSRGRKGSKIKIQVHMLPERTERAKNSLLFFWPRAVLAKLHLRFYFGIIPLVVFCGGDRLAVCNR